MFAQRSGSVVLRRSCVRLLAGLAALVVAWASGLPLARAADAAQPAAASQPAGAAPRVLFLLAEGFNNGEHWGAYVPLRAAGYQVDIAGVARGAIPVTPGKVDPDKDAIATLALDEVRPDDYIALVIPGGYSPGHLEKYPRALEICRAFMQAGKPVAAICHGPRLLIRAGLLQGRTMTSLNTVANELADDWRAGAYGFYLDEAVVEDGNLITSRYPNDVEPFSRAVLAKLAAGGGRPVPAITGANVLVLGPALSGHLRWVVTQLRTLGATVTVVSEKDLGNLVKDKLDTIKAANVLVVLGTKGAQGADVTEQVRGVLQAAGSSPKLVLATADAAALVPAGGPAVETLPATDLPGQLQAVVSAIEARKLGGPASQPATPARTASERAKAARTQAIASPAFSPDTAYGVVFALRPGFDEQVVQGLLTGLGSQAKRPVLLVGPAKGELRSINGGVVQITATPADAIKLADDALVIAPGGIWPRKAEARQATQPAWVDEQDRADQQRRAWLLDQYKSGRTLVLVGFDALDVGTAPQFKGLKFASSDQTVWSWGKDGGSYTADAAVKTADRLYSAKGAGAVPALLALLAPPAP